MYFSAPGMCSFNSRLKGKINLKIILANLYSSNSSIVGCCVSLSLSLSQIMHGYGLLPPGSRHCQITSRTRLFHHVVSQHVVTGVTTSASQGQGVFSCISWHYVNIEKRESIFLENWFNQGLMGTRRLSLMMDLNNNGWGGGQFCTTPW